MKNTVVASTSCKFNYKIEYDFWIFEFVSIYGCDFIKLFYKAETIIIDSRI